MAISTQRSLAELKKEAESLGINVTQSGSRESKTDYIYALRDYYLKANYPDGIPETLKMILNIESPQLSLQYTHLKPEVQESIWTDKRYIAEEKLDGCRMLIVKSGSDWQFYSRNISVKDFLPVSYSGHILETWNHDIEDDFILDCELISTSAEVSTILGKKGLVTTTVLQAVTALLALNSEETLQIQKSLVKDGVPVLQFVSFDCLYHNGTWLMDKPLYERKDHVDGLINLLKAAGMNITKPISNYSNKRAFYKALVSMGKEGIILKNVCLPYNPSNNRPSTGWVKVKRTMSETQQMLGMGDTLDAFVTGFEPADENKSWAGLVGALEFSVFLNKEDGTQVEHKIGRVTNLTMELREQITEVGPDGKPRLKKEWYGKCASLDGVCISGRAKRLKHCRLIEWRPDRSADTCVMDEEFLNSMVL